MNQNQTYILSAVMALFISNIIFQFYCNWLAKKRSLAACMRDENVYLPLYRDWEGKAFHRGYVTLWVTALLVGVVTAIVGVLWTASSFGLITSIQDYDWSELLHRNAFFLFGDVVVDFWPGDYLLFVPATWCAGVILIFCAILTCKLALSALLVWPVAQTISREEFFARANARKN